MCIRDRFENEERYFQVMLPSATSLAKGKKMVLMNTLNTSEPVSYTHLAVVAADYILGDKGGCRIIEVDVYPVILVTLHFTRCLFQIVDRTVQDSGFPHSCLLYTSPQESTQAHSGVCGKL